MAEQIKELAKFGAEFIPGVGEAMAIKRVSDAMDKKDYVGAGIETAAGALGVIPIVGDVAGKALRATTKTLRKDAKLQIDNPGYDKFYQRTYAEIKQESADEAKEKALKRGETDTYESNIGNAGGVTGYANKVKFKPEELKDLPGSMGEEKFRSSGEKLQRLKTDIKEKGYKEDPIMIHVREDGQPFIVEGNHRLAEALESGRDTITADIRYLRGAEEKEGLLDPRNIFPDKMKMAEGGVPMKKQMELFDDGGLKDEGGTVDPVSGNDVPPGSTQKEVRDDIPAQLSEGEFVFPADVVRYIGLEKLMQMRQEAKMGLSMMDKMGQMGNADEAVIPDDIPFELSDLDIEDDPVEMQQGGVARATEGVSYVPSQVQPSGRMLPIDDDNLKLVPFESPSPTQASVPIAPTYTPPTQQEVPTFTPEDMQSVSFPEVVQTPESTPKNVEIVNPTTGERRMITYVEGVTPLPEGFVLASEYDGSTQATSVTPVVGQAQVREDTTSERRKEKAMRAEMAAAESRKNMIKELFPDYLDADGNFKSGVVASPFSDLFGKQKPGTVTTGGYIVGDNGELLNPETGEQDFPGFAVDLGFKDKPPLDTSKEDGVNKRFRDAYLKKYAEDRSFKQVRSGVTAGDVALSKARKTQADKNKVAIKQKKKSDTARLREATKKESEKKSSSERRKIKKATDAAQKAVANIMKDKEREYNTGGLASKPKPKPKKMRQGGLASR